MPEWWYTDAAQKTGPVEADELRRLQQNGKVTLATLVWREGMAAWQPLGEVEALRPLTASSPPSITRATPPPLPGRLPTAPPREHETAVGGFIKTMSVAACGLVTSLLTALLVTVVQRLTGFSIFTFSVWLIIPAGAIGVGFVAASGYYFGSLYFHTRPTKLLFFQMVVVAALTQILIYYTDYETLILDDGRKVSELVPFQDYLNVTLTKAHYRVGRTQTDTGEVGNLGYGLAALQFVGFLIGGISAFVKLKNQPLCRRCDRYYRVLGTSTKTFTEQDTLAAYHDALFALPLDSPEFTEMARVKQSVKHKKGHPYLRLEMKLYGCPQCKGQSLTKEVAVFEGKDWKTVDSLTRVLTVPTGANIVGAFRTNG